MRIIRTLLLAPAAFLGLAAAAHADINAATEQPVAGDGFDIALIDTATGARLSLPPGINTSADEIHPSITPDGRRLVFERLGPAGSVRIIAADLPTGQQADLFNAFEAGQFTPRTPTITPDGQTVITGANSQSVSTGLAPSWIETSLANFPSGPFPHTIRKVPNLPFTETGHTLNPSFEPSEGVHGLTAIGFVRDHTPPINQMIIVDDSGKNNSTFGPRELAHPAQSAADSVIVFEQAGDSQHETDLAYRTTSTLGVPFGSILTLPGVNATNTTTLHPIFTTDGRYLVYRQQHFTTGQSVTGFPGHVRILVYDTATQTILDPNGANQGSSDMTGLWADEGNISLFQTFVLRATQVVFNGLNPLVLFSLNQPSSVGILVQRVVGHHRLFGRRVPTLRIIGRVPFGAFRRGHHRVRWNLRVGGHKLRRGTYLVTPRALTRRGRVRELATPRVIHIR